MVLCDIEGLSYEEIGATLGVKLGTVRSRIHRGRQALRDYLAAHMQVEVERTPGPSPPAGLCAESPKCCCCSQVPCAVPVALHST